MADLVMRLIFIVLVVLGLAQGVWIALADTIASWPGLHTEGTHFAATLGVVRGDLWAEAASAAADFPPRLAGDWHPIDADRAGFEARRALTCSPLRSDMWLLLSMLEPNLRPQAGQLGPLEMAFLTAGGVRRDLPARVLAAALSPALANQEVQDLLTVDVTYILTRDPDLIPSLNRAHAQAPEANRATLELIVHTIDPSFAFSS